tara:strand:- start:1272 stop:2318 length:1047 start_codon:yes stop_codon:yes gene_type:complete
MDQIEIKVDYDDLLADAIRPFDYQFDGTSRFVLPAFKAPPRDKSWQIGLIVGPSGSGKTQILKRDYGVAKRKKWNPNKAIASQVDSAKLSAVGLNSVPTWCRPYHVLSNGEAWRADLAAMIKTNVGVDEFTSVIDRTVAKSSAHAVQRYIRSQEMTGVVFSTCHYDVVEWLQPDWVFDTAKAQLDASRGCLRRPSINLEIHKTTNNWWGLFRQHHYLNDALNKSARCFLGYLDGNPVAFGSAIAFPNQHFESAWREHRTVVLPDYQGLGIGVRFSDAIAQHFCKQGHRYFSKTAHPRMGEYREQSKLWKATSKNKKARLDYIPDRNTKERAYKDAHIYRVAYSHEFVG